MIVNIPELVTVPPGVVMSIFPDIPFVITAVTVVEFTTVNDATGVPPILTDVVPVKFVPVMLIIVPTAPFVGVNEVMVGDGIKVKVPSLLAIPSGVVALIIPEVPFATTAETVVELTTVTEVAGVHQYLPLLFRLNLSRL